MRRRIFCIILVINLIFCIIPYNVTCAPENNKNVITKVYTNKEIILPGNKGIDYNISYIYMEHLSGYKVNSDKFDLNNLDEVVKLVVNGIEENPVDSKGNKKYTVEYNENLRRLEIKVKEEQSNLTHLKPFILRKHSHYNIHIPSGFFTNGEDSSDVINYNFTTKGDGEYGQDILKSMSPANNETEIDYNKGEIIFAFIDDIKLMKDAEVNKKSYFTITSETMTDPEVTNFDTVVEEDINNYLIYTEENRLKFKKKTGKLDDFANYKVEIIPNAVVLKNSDDIRNIEPIYNDYLIINFDTNNWVEWSYPKNNPKQNQGTIDQQRVERNPLIKIKFKYDVELIDKSKITLSSDGHIYSVDVNKDSWITYDGDILKIDINSLYRSGRNPLRANAAYKLTIGKGALRLKDYNISETDTKMENEEINLYFITGNWYAMADVGLRPIKYTSEEDYSYDNIVNLNTTKLAKDGNIYIHFHSDGTFPRELKWNQWTANPKIEDNEEALQYFKLYKSPQAYTRDHDGKGIVYDKEFRYDINKKSIPLNGLDEIPLRSVDIVKDVNGNNTNILKITPKYDLIPYNKYIIKLTNREILTDNYEKIMAENERLVTIGQEIWTAPSRRKENPFWDMSLISPEEIIEVERGPHKTYTIHGAPQYNEYIDNDNGKPIILYVNKEVVPNLSISNPLNGITLFEGYREGDTSLYKRNIKWYQLEYFFDKDGNKKTKISIYPEGELHVGRYYKLDIDRTVFRSRSDQELKSITLDFVIEGDGIRARGIYKFVVTNKEKITKHIDRPFLITDFEPTDDNVEFSITGYNFAEDIKQLRFVRVPDGNTITIPKTDLIFHDVTKITGTIKGNPKAEFAKIIKERECGITKTSAGVYNVYVDFERGESAALTTINQRFIVKDRPKVIDTTPYDGEQYFDPELLYKKFTNPEEEGYYIKATFEDIGGMLKIKNFLNHRIQVNVEGGSNLVDNTRPLRFEREQPVSQYSTTKFHLYIPLSERLKDGQKYEVFIPEESVMKYEYIGQGGVREDLNTIDETRIGDNRCYKWTFDTNYFPKVDRLYEGSVPEFYDWKYPIVIDGSMFHTNTSVRFRHENGEFYSPSYIDIKDNNTTIYVYLPRSPRLPVGLYDIIISNGTPYDTEVVYGVFSVVVQGDYIPNEEYRVKDDSSLGTVKEIIKTSKDILELGSRHTNKVNLEINLDELMGSETWVRSIEYPVSWSDNIEELKLKSKWTNTTLYNLNLHDDADEEHIELRVGRLESSMADILKKKLIGINIKSNFIEVSGANFDFTSLTIEIPYYESDGSNLRLLRYDELTRQFENTMFLVDLINGKVKGISNKPGIFVIVE